MMNDAAPRDPDEPSWSEQARWEIRGRASKWRVSRFVPEQPSADQPPTDAQIGVALLNLHIRQAEWVRRRMERVWLHDDRVLRRQVTLDFDLPEDVPPVRGHSGEVLIPLTTLQKQPLALFDLSSSDGGAVSLASSAENARFMTAGFIRWLEGFAPEELPDALARDIEHFIGSRHDDPERERDRIGELVQQHYGGTLDPDQFDAWHKALADFAGGFLAIARLHPDHTTSGILKYSYDESFNFGGFSGFERLGWRPARVELELPNIAGAASYHFETVPPQGMGWTSTELGIIPREGEPYRAASPVGSQPHVHLHAAETPPIGSTGVVSMRLVPQPRGFLGVALAVTLVAAFVLFGFYLHLEAFTQQRSAGASQLLTVVGLGASFLLRSSEHRLLSLVLRGPRALAWLAQAVVFAGAALLLVDLPHEYLVELWRSGVVLTAGAALLILLAGRESRALNG